MRVIIWCVLVTQHLPVVRKSHMVFLSWVRQCYVAFDILWLTGRDDIPEGKGCIADLRLDQRKEVCNRSVSVFRPLSCMHVLVTCAACLRFSARWCITGSTGLKCFPFRLCVQALRKNVSRCVLLHTASLLGSRVSPVLTCGPFLEQAILTRFQSAIDDRKEGIVMKESSSKYLCSSRDDKWVKLKPDYMEGYNKRLDCLILGGYYGDGRVSEPFLGCGRSVYPRSTVCY